MPSLQFTAGPIAGRRFKLADGELVIGRRADCQIFVPDMRVSRQHARLWKRGEQWSLEDLGSNNGTFINGVRVYAPAELHHDDEIVIANNHIRVDAQDLSAEVRLPESSALTIVDVTGSSLHHAREETHAFVPRLATDSMSASDARALRLIERKLDALTKILRATAGTDTPDALLDALVDALLELFPRAEDVGVLVPDDKTGELRTAAQRHRDPPRPGSESGVVLPRTYTSPLRVPGTIITHVQADKRSVLLGELSDELEPIGTRMGAPLTFHDTQYGVVYVESREPAFRQEDVDLLQAVATHAGLALHSARVAAQLARRDQLERDLRVARQIQRHLLPAALPQVVGLDFAVHYEPAYQIGGDFYDFIWHDPSHLGLAIGDVSGKAISAALYMARLTSELRSRAAIARAPARLLRRVNAEMMALGDEGMFATLAYCIYDLETRGLVFTNAGHCVPLLRRGDRVFPLQAERASTQPLGIFPDLDAGEARVQLHSGDMLIMVSDGILEARDSRGSEYGLARLSRRIRTARGRAEDIVKAILADIDNHSRAHAQGDDMTIVAMAIDDRRAKRKTTTLPGVTQAEVDTTGADAEE